MTEKVWCKREKKIVKAIENVVIGVGIIAAIGAVVFCFAALIGYTMGYIPVPVPSNPNDTLLGATGICTTLVIAIGGFMSVVCADESKGTDNMFLYSKGLLAMALILSVLTAVTEIVRFTAVIGYAMIIGIIIIGPVTYTHIKCEEEKFIAGEKK